MTPRGQLQSATAIGGNAINSPQHFEEFAYGLILAFSGIATIATRIRKLALLDIEGFALPATGLFITLPDGVTGV